MGFGFFFLKMRQYNLTYFTESPLGKSTRDKEDYGSVLLMSIRTKVRRYGQYGINFGNAKMEMERSLKTKSSRQTDT